MSLKGILQAAQFGRAHGLMLKGRYQKAEKILRNTIDSDPDHYMVPVLREDLGICLCHLGDHDKSHRLMSELADRLLTESVKGDFELDLDMLERIDWYIRANEKAMKTT